MCSTCLRLRWLPELSSRVLWQRQLARLAQVHLDGTRRYPVCIVEGTT